MELVSAHDVGAVREVHRMRKESPESAVILLFLGCGLGQPSGNCIVVLVEGFDRATVAIWYRRLSPDGYGVGQKVVDHVSADVPDDFEEREPALFAALRGGDVLSSGVSKGSGSPASLLRVST